MNFLEMLNDVLKEYSDIRVTQLTGIERTRVNRIRNGKFRIEFEELRKITKGFMLDSDTTKKLYEAYLFEKLGADRYKSRMLAKQFLSSLKFPESDSGLLMGYSTASFNADFDIPEDVVTLDSLLSVRNAVTTILSKACAENDHIKIISSPFDEYLLSNIFALTSAVSDLNIEHIYSLSSVNELSEPLTYYMEVARAVYPIFMLNTNYNAYYSIAGHSTNALMPFQIITSSFSMTMSLDGTSAILVKKKSVIDIYSRLFDRKISQCTPFIKKIRTSGEYLENYLGIMESVNAKSSGKTLITLDFEPCVLHFFNRDDLGQMLEKTKNDERAHYWLENIVNNQFGIFSNKPQIAYFTKKGVDSFIETGRILEIPEAITPVIGYEHRREMLCSVLDCIKSEKSALRYYMLKENEFDPPLGLRFLGTGVRNGDYLYVISKEHEGMCSILSFSNPDVTSVVFDFLSSLNESGMVFTKEETIEYLETVIDSMK